MLKKSFINTSQNYSLSYAEADQEGFHNFYRRAILIAFDFIWKALLSDRNFATLLDPPPLCVLFCKTQNTKNPETTTRNIFQK